MADYTEHYQLHQWQPQDPFLRTDFNADFQKIDSALEEMSTNFAAQATELITKGNCEISWGSYTGDGKNGAEHPNELSFPALPLMVFISSPSRGQVLSGVQGARKMMTFGGDDSNTASWEGNSISWYTEVGNTSQFNNVAQFNVVALLKKDT